MQKKYIFITGGVLSSLGKGLTAAAIAMLLEHKDLKIAVLKLDPYLNVDPGTMSPLQHGEVYVTDDGAETDLDIGHYYRYTNAMLSRASNVTSGQIYDTVIKNERRGLYLGNTVQVIPHITDEIRRRILHCSTYPQEADVVLIEIGGTVGDIESLPFLEAIRQFRDENRENCLNIHLTYIPYLKAAGELKTKPTQHSIQALRSIGIFADIILCRSEESLPPEIRSKIHLFCGVREECVIELSDVENSIYEVPLILHQQSVDDKICRLLNICNKPIDLSPWHKILASVLSPKQEVTIAIVGKYVQHQDAYKSVYEALQHAGIAHTCKIHIRRIEADKIHTLQDVADHLKGCDGCLIPGGFGLRGWEGTIQTARYCREHFLPCFGICLGMQIIAVEFARHVAGLVDANSTEMDALTPQPLISLLTEQKHIQDLGGTMRLGAYPCRLKEGSKSALAYGKDLIYERHRHRYEFNNAYTNILQAAGLTIAGVFEESNLCEIVEVVGHPWMVGVQFHPEFQSKPTDPHALFRDFVGAIIQEKEKHST